MGITPKVAVAMEGVEVMGAQIDWLDKVIGEIQRELRHHELSYRSIESTDEGDEKQMDDTEEELMRMEAMKTVKDMLYLSVENYNDPEESF